MMSSIRTLMVTFVLTGAAGSAELIAQDTLPAAEPPPSFSLQADTSFVVDRVVAVVGHQPILASEVEEQFFTRISGANPPALSSEADSAALREAILGRMVDDELLVQEAQRDTSVKVTEQEVSEGVAQQTRRVRGQFTSEVDFRRELTIAGFQTPEEFRRYLAEQQRRQFLRTRLIEHLKATDRLKPIPPTESEMRAFFEENAAEFGQQPAAVTFRQIVIAPKATPEARLRALTLADSIAKALREGGDFATAARRFSEDPGSREQGGDLGWQRRGTFERAFDQVVFNLKPGVISDPVETVFGYHVIQVERVQPTEVQARHILVTPATTPADVDSARALAGRAADSARAGASFDSLQRVLHDAAEEREASAVPLDRLPEAYAQALAAADSGAVIGPFDLPGPDGRVKFAILRLTSRRPAGAPAYADVQEQLRRLLAEDLATRQYLERLRATTYVDIRTD